MCEVDPYYGTIVETHRDNTGGVHRERYKQPFKNMSVKSKMGGDSKICYNFNHIICKRI